MNHSAWPETLLGKLMTLEYGSSLRDAQRTGVGYPVFGSNGQVGWHSNYLVAEPAIVVGRKGSVGAVNWSDGPFWPIDTTYYVRIAEDCDLRWFFWLLKSLEIGRLDSSTGVPGLNRNDAYRVQVKKPSRIEQMAIAHVLDADDESIVKTEALIAKLKAIKQGLLHDLLTRGLDDNGDLRDFKKHPEHFKESSCGRIPANWDVGPFAKYVADWAVGPRFSGNLYARDGNIATLRTTDMDDEGNVSLATMPRARLSMETFRTHLLQPGDLVISRSGTCGVTGVFSRHDLPVLPGAFLLRFRLNEGMQSEFARLYLNSPMGRLRVLREAEGGVQKNIRGTSVLPILMAVPKVFEQQEIVTRIEAHETSIRSEETCLAKLKAIKKGLMQDLLLGRVRVPEEMLRREIEGERNELR